MSLWSEGDEERVSWCTAGWHGEWSGGFALFYASDDRAAGNGGSGWEDGMGDFPDGDVCDWTQCFAGYGRDELQCGGTVDV